MLNKYLINKIRYEGKGLYRGLLGQGKTAKEAIEDFYNSYEEAKQMLAEEGKECPDVDFEFYNDVPSFLQQYAFILTLAGLEKVTGVSQTILSHYISGYRHPSREENRGGHKELQPRTIVCQIRVIVW